VAAERGFKRGVVELRGMGWGWGDGLRHRAQNIFMDTGVVRKGIEEVRGHIVEVKVGESRSFSAAERARRPFLRRMNPHAVPVANDCVWCEYHNAMSTECCTHCKQSHPGRACDYDDQGECAETAPEPETQAANSAAAKKASVPPQAGTNRA
jgi:hypothetical protein